MEIHPWGLRDPGVLIDEVAKRHVVHSGLVVAALVEHASSAQRLVATDVVYDDERPPEPWRLRDLVRAALLRLPIPRWSSSRPPVHTVVLVIARRGRVVFSSQDVRWGYGVLYGKNLLDVICGDVILMTEHGWRSMDDDSAGATPALAA